jgi:hypothetical protein
MIVSGTINSNAGQTFYGRATADRIAGVLYEPHQPHKAGWQDRSVSNLTFATCFNRFSSIRLDPC